ncbi:MAG: hypothetical protein HY262_12505 [Chloroflexi bacterium]|nr:hypothetical protein [Chloroflexota bacterium]
MTRFGRSATDRDRDPHENHRFVEIDDPGMGAAASGSAFRSTDAPNILGVTTAFLRSSRCAMPGCGKERHDPIHAPADD